MGESEKIGELMHKLAENETTKHRITLGGKEVARLYLRPRHDGGIKITDLWVHPSHRGRGLASALLKSGVKNASEDVYLKIEDDKPHIMHRLKQMYQRHGFVPLGDREMVLRKK